MKKLLLSFFALTLLMIPSLAQAEIVHSTVGVQGYDLTTYYTGAKPLPGNGNHVVTHNDVNYLFTSDANKKEFEKNPGKYLPAYGGYCAYGVAVGKKFIADPNVYEVVDGKLYLNLDNKVKGIWAKDISGNISKADENWKAIKDKSPSDL